MARVAAETPGAPGRTPLREPTTIVRGPMVRCGGRRRAKVRRVARTATSVAAPSGTVSSRCGPSTGQPVTTDSVAIAATPTIVECRIGASSKRSPAPRRCA